jgi:hypothetical protein
MQGEKNEIKPKITIKPWAAGGRTLKTSKKRKS